MQNEHLDWFLAKKLIEKFYFNAIGDKFHQNWVTLDEIMSLGFDTDTLKVAKKFIKKQVSQKTWCRDICKGVLYV